MSLLSFVQSILPFAQQSSQQTGLPLDFVISQAALESGNGTSNLAINSNNFFGIKNPGGGSYASYSDPAGGFGAYSNLINSPRYAGIAGTTSDPLALGNAINAAGYSQTPDYGSRVASLVPGVDQALAALGVNNASSAVPGAASGGASGSGGATSNSSTSSGTLSTVGNFVKNAGIMLVAIIILGAGLWMLKK